MTFIIRRNTLKARKEGDILKATVRILALVLLVLLLFALIISVRKNSNQSPSVPTASHCPTTTSPPTLTQTLPPPETTLQPETTVPHTTPPLHSPLYLEGVSVEDVILYFNEVCLDAEYVEGGTPELVQKWVAPITYYVDGDPTDEDLRVLNDLAAQLNSIDHFPGMKQVDAFYDADLPIHFCTKQEMGGLMSFSVQEELDGAVTYWYNDEQEITNGIICIRTDLTQQLRNSVIVEEIYNCLGPIQDTVLREDSIIYQYGSDILSMSEIDVLLLKLLYHPQIQCGMTVTECESVIRQLYY